MTGLQSFTARASSPPPPAYPLRLTGRFDPETGRWLWLVKFVLIIPHAIVLAFLWLAAVLLSAVAFVAILVTGRYPRSIFEFVVGVLRWTWRVSFYTTAAFGTDRYPPFSLEPDPTYPADLQVDYPDHLSRGLVLVKWWLLAIPQYIVVGLLAGGWGGWHLGVITVLALVGAVRLLIGRDYPPQLFALVMGLNRWTYRVAAYALLLTDEYPPFRLDQGGAEPTADPRVAN